MMIVVSVSCNVPAQVATSSIHTTGHFLHFACVSKRHNFALLFDHSLHIFFAYDELTVFNPSPLHTFSRASVALTSKYYMHDKSCHSIGQMFIYM
jgi:hypothetical protein